MNRKPTFILPALLACLLLGSGHACTTFLLQSGDELAFGRNYDWMVDDALIITNKRNITKTATTEHNPARWTSKYGSITLRQYCWRRKSPFRSPCRNMSASSVG